VAEVGPHRPGELPPITYLSGGLESAAIRIGPSGKIFVTTGAAAQGQGTRAMLAQLAAGVLGVRPQQIHVIDGDTAASPLGTSPPS